MFALADAWPRCSLNPNPEPKIRLGVGINMVNLVCENCGAQLNANDRFCPECGHILSATSADPGDSPATGSDEQGAEQRLAVAESEPPGADANTREAKPAQEWMPRLLRKLPRGVAILLMTI